MRNSPTISLAALALSVFALGALLLDFGGTAAGPDAGGPAIDGGVYAGLRAEIEALRAQNLELHDRLAALELRPASEPQRMPITDDAVSRQELQDLRNELLGTLGGEIPLAAGGEAPQLKEQVGEALAAIRKEETAEKIRNYHEQRMERLDQDVAKIGEWLGLDPVQSDSMRAALVMHYDREAAQRRMWENGADAAEMDVRKGNDRQAFRSDVGVFLNAEQFETFWSRFGADRGK